ncbi:TrkH family potassium uptake protein [uncultured Paenalcaligenes sp.]|uniref:TrkH family potassium uptake protein n=1 Tax=uncultured Paenalcaligenes sp. TaxID=1588925 RepID=UPI00260D6949|nr:potassium transporter TrkG [uncultured Paenalcaligenes sp.]
MLRIWPFRLLRKQGSLPTTHLPASPPIVLAMGFLGLIILGTVLLKMPFATRSPISWFEAFFTATSAVTVTGLTVIEPATVLSIPGQVLITILVQIGGLGFVTFAVLAAITLGKRISLQQQALALEAFNQTSVSRIRQTAFSVLKIAFTIQGITMLWLTFWWGQRMELKQAAYQAYFHVTMAFNNAGMALYENSLIGLTHDPLSIFTLSLMIILGGLGFPVIMNLLRKKRWSLLSAYSKIILLGTLALNVLGFLAIWTFEHKNAGTIGHLPWFEQATASWLQIISSRTSGFVAMDAANMKDSSTLLIMVYMFIGGGSLSTASGIKLGTFIVLLAAVVSYLRHREEVVLMHRTVSPETVQKSLSLVLITFGLFFFGLLFITIFDNLPFRSVMFEVMSAITTTGMSFGITGELSLPSQCMLTLLMFAGRLGPLTLVYSLATRRRSRIRYPEGHFQVG